MFVPSNSSGGFWENFIPRMPYVNNFVMFYIHIPRELFNTLISFIYLHVPYYLVPSCQLYVFSGVSGMRLSS